MASSQLELHLPAPPSTGETPLVPARMVNEFVYCPRLAYLMWSQSEWSETADTVDGRRVHRRTDKPNEPLPAPDALDPDDPKLVSRAMTLSSERLGVIAKIDLVEADDGVVTPVEYKRGKRPHIAGGAYDPEKVQVCLQALLLEDHGYQVNEGVIYYAESRERVRIALDGDLRHMTKEAVSRLRLAVAGNKIPPPLTNSPKCPKCALVTICLPDEMQSLGGSDLAPRPIAVATDDAMPLIVQSQRARVMKEGNTLKIIDEEDGTKIVRLIEISDVALYGNISITTPALTALMENGIPVTFHSHGGWFRGIAHGLDHRNVEIRTAQYRSSFDDNFCLHFARDLIAAKIVNQRTILRRNWRGDTEERASVLDRLRVIRKSVQTVSTLGELLGVEGNAAAIYFRAFSGLLAPPEDKKIVDGEPSLNRFEFHSRNRRPPRDPINAMLSLAYAMLARHLTVALTSIGLDPYRGFYHAPRYGRPALALDIMEPFRSIIADSVVLSAVNTGEVTTSDFVVAATGTSLTSAGRRRFIGAFERRLSQETIHPLFGYRVSLRRLLLIQARLLARHLLGEIPSYPHHLPR